MTHFSKNQTIANIGFKILPALAVFTAVTFAGSGVQAMDESKTMEKGTHSQSMDTSKGMDLKGSNPLAIDPKEREKRWKLNTQTSDDSKKMGSKGTHSQSMDKSRTTEKGMSTQTTDPSRNQAGRSFSPQPSDDSRNTASNENISEKKWKQLSGKVKQNWEKLSREEIEQINGNTQELASVIQKKYDVSQEEAEGQVKTFKERYDSN